MTGTKSQPVEMGLPSLTKHADQDSPKVPAISKELVEHLQRMFPDKAPGFTLGIREIRHKSGQVSVVEYLKTQYERQNPISA